MANTKRPRKEVKPLFIDVTRPDANRRLAEAGADVLQRLDRNSKEEALPVTPKPPRYAGP